MNTYQGDDERNKVKPKLVPAVARAGAIIDYIAAQDGPRSLAQLVRELEIPKSSLHGLLQTLCTMEILRSVDNDRFALGPQLLRWSHALISGTTLVNEFYSILAHDRKLDRYTVTLSEIDKNDVVYLAGRNSDAPLGITFRIGMRLPAVFTATGKAMYACLSQQDLAKKLPKTWPKPLTEKSVKNKTQLAKEITLIREHGYSIDNCQLREDMYCVGAAIVNQRGEAAAGIGLSMTRTEANSEKIEEMGQAVLALARKLAPFS